jgi:hypothetical protein
VVELIDFWENGEPDHMCQIFGVIGGSKGDDLISQFHNAKAIAKVARECSGVAVILFGRSLDSHDVGMNAGTVRFRRLTKFVAVK